MEYFASHPTTFRNVNYRSRLEAKWASFFTDLGWEFQYEPFDLKGWVPDFEIMTNNKTRLLVEVKPVSFNDKGFNHDETFTKAINFDDEFNILLLGTNIFYADDDYVCIGYLTGPHYKPFGWEKETVGPDVAALKFLDNKFDISGYYGMWTNAIFFYNRKNVPGHDYKKFISKWGGNHLAVEGFWADAHNNTKFDAFRYYNGYKYPGL